VALQAPRIETTTRHSDETVGFDTTMEEHVAYSTSELL
jgi:hypothetical protein